MTSAVAIVLQTASVPAANLPSIVHAIGIAIPVARPQLYFKNCRAAAEFPGETGKANIFARYRYTAAEHADGAYRGLITYDITDQRITVSRLTWPHMTASERKAADASERALLRHEVGHFIVANRSLRISTGPESFQSPSAALYAIRARQMIELRFKSFHQDQLQYDILTRHGIRQQLADAELAGTSTKLICPDRPIKRAR